MERFVSIPRADHERVLALADYAAAIEHGLSIDTIIEFAEGGWSLKDIARLTIATRPEDVF